MDNFDEFRTIPSLNNEYEINCNGTIIRNSMTKKPLTIRLDMHHSKTGYYVTFINRNKKCIRLMIHKMVAEAWIGPNINHLEIDHIDRISTNNHYTNLRYVTHSEQMKNRVMSKRLISIAINNCKEYNKSISNPVAIINDKMDIEWFESISSCSREYCHYFNLSSDRFRHLLERRIEKYSNVRIVYLSDHDKLMRIINTSTNKTLLTDKLYLAAYWISLELCESLEFMDYICEKLRSNKYSIGDSFEILYGV